MEQYGCDRPDLRFGMELKNLEDIASKSTFTVFKEKLQEGGTVKGLCVKGGGDISRKQIDDYTDFVGRLGIKGLAWIKKNGGELSSSIVKFFDEPLQKALVEKMEMEDGDLIFMIADQKNIGKSRLRPPKKKISKRPRIDKERSA